MFTEANQENVYNVYIKMISVTIFLCLRVMQKALKLTALPVFFSSFLVVLSEGLRNVFFMFHILLSRTHAWKIGFISLETLANVLSVFSWYKISYMRA